MSRDAQRQVAVIDTTLRDGAQAPGARFTHEQRVDLAQRLGSLGVDEIEVGTPAMGEPVRRSIRSIVRSVGSCRLTGWCRALAGDLEAASACDLEAVHVSVPTSDVQLSALGRTWDWVEQSLASTVPLARRRFAYVSIGMMDASRAPLSRVGWLARLASDLGADRLRLADTVGVWNPRQTAAAVAQARRAAPGLTLGVHTHNDLGMAVGNAIAAAEAGADAIDVTVGGVGERAGNAALEQVVMALQMTTDLHCAVDSLQLTPVCDLVARWRGIGHRADQPIVGGNVFRHESGIHVRGVLRDPASFEPFAPQRVGRRGREIVLGAHSGRAAVAWALREAGLGELTGAPERLETMVNQVRAEAQRQGTDVSLDRLRELAQVERARFAGALAC
jgi:homocitrate synthase NifV